MEFDNLNSNFDKELEEQARLEQQLKMLEQTAKSYLSKEALARYGNLKSAYPEKAIQVIMIIVQAVQRGQIREKIDDEKFKELLWEIERLKGKKEFKIQRK